MLEFALVLPVMLAFVLVIITLEVLFFQLTAVHNAAAAAAETVATENTGIKPGSGGCEKDNIIAQSAQRAASIVSVNSAKLCGDPTDPTALSAQAPVAGNPGNDLQLRVTAEPTVYTPCLITATAQYTLRPLGGFTLLAPTVTSSSTIEAAPGCSTAK